MIELDEQITKVRQNELLSKLQCAIDLEKSGCFHDSIDHLFDLIDSLFVANKFNECDFLLRNAPLDHMHTNLLVGFLSITVTHKNFLKERVEFVSRVKIRLQCLAPARVNSLMSGLE